MRYLAALAALVVCLALPGSATPATYHPSLNAVASWLSQRPVKVRCLTKRESEDDYLIGVWGASAYVEIHEGRPKKYTVFAYPLCKTLRDVQRGEAEAWTADDVVWAIMVMVHEAGHLRGADWPFWRSEAQVNTWTLKRSFAVAVLRFGIQPEAKRLFNSIAIDIYLGQPKEYRSEKCQRPFVDEAGDVGCAH